MQRASRRIWLGAVAATLAGVTVSLMGCGGGVGACVSDPVQFQEIGQRVYCYEDWYKEDCDEHQTAQVNGVDWTFYSGQTCSDRGYVTGSNPYP